MGQQRQHQSTAYLSQRHTDSPYHRASSARAGLLKLEQDDAVHERIFGFAGVQARCLLACVDRATAAQVRNARSEGRFADEWSVQQTHTNTPGRPLTTVTYKEQRSGGVARTTFRAKPTTAPPAKRTKVEQCSGAVKDAVQVGFSHVRPFSDRVRGRCACMG